MRIFTLMVCVTLFGLALGPNSKASDFDKKTILTFSESVQIPGAVLGAGTYVVQRADPGGNPDVVRFLSSDGMHVYATVLTIPAERGTPPDKPEVTFAETRGGTPQALKKWWYPGETTGEEFIYPKGTPVMMAKASNLEMPARSNRAASAPSEPAPAPAEQQASSSATEPSYEPSSSAGEVEIAQVTNPTPEPSSPQSSASSTASGSSQKQPESLPKTASDIPLLALLGVLTSLGGAGLNALARTKV